MAFDKRLIQNYKFYMSNSVIKKTTHHLPKLQRIVFAKYSAERGTEGGGGTEIIFQSEFTLQEAKKTVDGGQGMTQTQRQSRKNLKSN
jgi:hypothetical protein